MSKGNFKVRCIDNVCNPDLYTNGKIYEFKNGHTITNSGMTMPYQAIGDFNEWCEFTSSRFELVNDYPAQTITICHKGNRVIAVLTDTDGNFIKSAKARYNPNDALEGKPFDFEVGKRIAVRRLLGEGNVKLSVSLDGKKIAQSVVKAIGTVKDIPLTAKLFKVGDQVRFKKNREGIDTYCIGETTINKYKDNRYTVESYYIENNDRGYIRLKEDGMELAWNPELFELATETSFDWQSFKSGKFAVHCDTEEKAREFLRECDEQGIKWCTGQRPIAEQKETRWEIYKHNTSYSCDSCGGLVFGTADKKTTINYTPSKPTVKEVKRPAKVGEWIKVVEIDCCKYGVYIPGDIILVTKGVNGLVIEGNNRGTLCRLMENEYVVLENYQPKKIKPEEPKPKTLADYTIREIVRELLRRYDNE